MEKIKKIEELIGDFGTIWIAYDINNQFHMTNCLEFKEEGGKIIPDIELTKWRSINNERHHHLTDEHYIKKTFHIDTKDQEKVKTKNKSFKL